MSHAAAPGHLSDETAGQAAGGAAPCGDAFMQRAVALLRGMVEISSLSREEHALAEFLVREMRGLGFEAHIDAAGNAVGVRPARRTPARDIVLLGHMDTVAGVVPVQVVGDLLFGRGTVDAKGPLATFIMGAATANVPDDVRLVVIGAVEEECATSAGARYAAANYRPAACVIGEPSHADGFTLGYKGRVLIDLEIVAPSAHSAGPDPTAAELGFEWWRRLNTETVRFNVDKRGVFEQLQPKLRSCRTEHDGLHDTMRMQVGVRLPPGITAAECEAMVNSVAAATLGSVQYTIAFTGAEEAYVADRSSALARAFTCAIRDLGGTPRPRVKTGTADMNVVGPVWKCPIVAYGPGDSALDHTPNEHVSLSEYGRAIATLRRVLETVEL